MIADLKAGDIIVVKDSSRPGETERLARVVKVMSHASELLVELKRTGSDYFGVSRIVDISDVVRVEARL